MDRRSLPMNPSHVPTMGSSPSQSSLAHHSLPTHMLNREALLALQDAYSNPQFEDEYNHPKPTPAPIRTMLPASHLTDYSANRREDYFTLPRTQSPLYRDGSISPPLGISATRVDPTPLLTNSEVEPTSPMNVASQLPPPASSDPHKPLRRWLYDFPECANSFFYTFDNFVTRIVQSPLATVGGLTTSLEEEILESNEMTNQQRRDEEEERRKSKSSHSRGGSARRTNTRSQSLPNTVLRKSMAITRMNKFLVAVALLYTGLTTIELGVFFPLFLFLSGYDELATIQLLMTSFAAIGSQVFKRFVWRQRPWMQSRAIVVKRDKTSSFPSRAVTCAVVYAYGFSHLFYPMHHVPVYVWLPAILLFALGAAISRIFVGAHFASDCIAGGLLGGLFCFLGSLLNKAIESGCGSCWLYDCYAQTLGQELGFDTFFSLNMLIMGLISGVSIICVGLAMSSPLHFWTKCTNIFGILFPCFAFRLVLLCPAHNSSGLALLSVGTRTVPFIVYCLLLAAGTLVFTKLLCRLTVIDHTVQLNTESQSSEDGIRGALDGIEASVLSANSPSISRSRPNSISHSQATVESSVSSIGAGSVLGVPSSLGHSEAISRHFLQCSSFTSTIWNLSVYFMAYTSVFLVLFVWRVFAVTKADPTAE